MKTTYTTSFKEMIGDISKDDFNKRHNKMCITEGINFFLDRNFPLDCELC